MVVEFKHESGSLIYNVPAILQQMATLPIPHQIRAINGALILVRIRKQVVL
jgi:hypothetical protein